jgi:hypothetical protein
LPTRTGLPGMMRRAQRTVTLLSTRLMPICARVGASLKARPAVAPDQRLHLRGIRSAGPISTEEELTL